MRRCRPLSLSAFASPPPTLTRSAYTRSSPVTFFAVDLDIDRSALQRARGDTAFAQELRAALAVEGPRLLRALVELGFAPLFENSGYKGRHFWVFLAEPAAASVAHLLGRMFVAWQSPQLPPGLHLEFFPKQASLKGKGLGNLIKLPLGIHRVKLLDIAAGRRTTGGA